MSVKHSLLAILSSGPSYGYQLKGEFERRTASTWLLNIGQVYSTLDRLVRDGLAEPRGEDAEGRVHYAITAAGRAEVLAWFATPLEVAQPPRNDLAIKLTIAAATPGVDLTALVQAQRTATMRTLQHYTLAKRKADPGDLPWLLVVEQMILYAEAEARWLDHADGQFARVNQLSERAATQPPSDAAASETRRGAASGQPAVSASNSPRSAR